MRRAALSGFTYGDGSLIIDDVVPPPTSDLSGSGDVVIVDLSITRDDETIRSRTQVRARN